MRNKSLDILKFVAAIFVIFIHIPFPGTFGVAVRAFARFAVPTFFMISGYFSYKAIQANEYKKIAKRTLLMIKLFGMGFLLYSVVLIIIWDSVNINFELKSIDTYIKTFVFNWPLNDFYIHLWYLLFMVYVYLIVMFAMRINKVKLLKLAPLLSLVTVVGFDYVIGYLGVIISPLYFRNFLMMGLPSFMIGYLFKEHEAKLMSIGKIKSIIVAVVGVLLLIVEMKLFNCDSELYLGSLLIASGLFALSLNIQMNVENSKLFDFIASSSLHLYIVHRLVGSLLQWLEFSLYDNLRLRPILVLVVSFVASLMYYMLKQLIAKNNRNAVS